MMDEKTTPPADEAAEAVNENTEPTVNQAEKDSKEEKKKDKKKDKELDELKKQLTELNDKYVRLFAEYENYRKRSVKEKESTYADAYADALELLLPIADSLDQAITFATDDSDLSKGLLLLHKQFSEAMARAGIEEIAAEGEQFNPELHNAVMHEESEQYGENTVSMVLRKGYKRGNRILRHSMVKVAN